MSGVSFTQVWLSLADRIMTEPSGMSSITSRKGVGAGVVSSCHLSADAQLDSESIRTAVRHERIRHGFNGGVFVTSIVCTRISYHLIAPCGRSLVVSPCVQCQ